MRKFFILSYLLLLFFAVDTYAQKIDFNLTSRSASQVTEEEYMPWGVNQGTSDTLTVDTVSGLRIAVAKGKESAGSVVKSCWWKQGVNTYSKLVGDGVSIYGLDANNNTPQVQGGSVNLAVTLIGLKAGAHSILAYHNNTDGYDACPLDVYLNGTKVLEGIEQSNRAEKPSASGLSYVKFTADGKTPVLLEYKSVPNASVDYMASGTSRTTTVVINALVLDQPNPKTTALDPFPSSGDLQVDGDKGSISMSWTAATSAVKHHLYIGTSETEMKEVSTQTGTSYVLSDVYSMNTYYWRVDEENASGTIYTGDTWHFRPRHLAFPGAEGYGKYAIGGRGGKVYHVTNLLNDGNPGSFKYGLVGMTEPRTIVFDVSGVIDMNFEALFVGNNVTIAGQTAPGKGICLKHSNLNIGSENICRFLRARRGAGVTGNAMGITGADHTIVDHVSLSWGTDETFSSRGAHNVTFQNSIIAEALGVAGHKNYTEGTNHGYAATIGGDTGSFHHNLLVDCYGRNWSMGGGLDGSGAYSGRLDIFNNVCYNWGARATDGGAHEVNFVGNYYKMGKSTKQEILLKADLEGTGSGTQSYYVNGNIRENLDGTKTTDKEGVTYKYTTRGGQVVNWTVFQDKAFFESYAKIETAQAAYKNVLSNVGANMPVLDDHDQRMISETLGGTYTYVGSVSGLKGQIDDESDCGGFENYPEEKRADDYDTDQDGMPDWWETLKGLNKNVADGNADPDKDGYTNLEDYLNWLSEPHFVVETDEKGSVNLKDYFSGYNNVPSYTVNGNEKVTVSNGSFTSAKKNETGLYDVTVTCSDADKIGSLSRTFHFAILGTSTGIEDITKNASITNYEFYNMAGMLVRKMITMNTGSLSQGVYLVKAFSGNDVVRIYKFLKK